MKCKNIFFCRLRNLLLLFMCTLFLVSCTSPKDKFITDLSNFTEKTASELETYSSPEWKLAVRQYQVFRAEKELYNNEFSSDDLKIIDDCYKRMNSMIAKGVKNMGTELIKGSSNSVSDSTTKENYIKLLVAFEEKTSLEEKNYSQKEWNMVMKEYQQFRERRQLYDNRFSEEEIAVVDDCYRKLNSMIVKGVTKNGVKQFKNSFGEMKNLLEDIISENNN